MTITHLGKLTAVSVLALSGASAIADGIYRNGVGSRAMAMGGADVAYASDPLGAMAANPAGLGFLTGPELDLSMYGASPYGDFNKAGSGGHLNSQLGVSPDAAFAMPLGKTPFTAGLSFVTDTALDSDWHYGDPPSAGGVTYGSQRDRSEIIVFRSALGLGVQLSPQWSLGANVGLDYNENRLQAPYIFQSGALSGAKVLLDMTTTGLGWNGEIGALFRATTNLEFGVAYKSPTTIFSHGTASGDAGAQLGVATYPYQYDAQVKNVLPQVVTAGASWQFCDQWRAALQLDWINYADAFKQLPASLSNGHTALPASYDDYVPLNWANEFVYRAGIEYYATPRLVLRGGYCYGGSPVPNQTLTPLTAVITEHTLTTGIGYHWNRYGVDLAYQWDLPATRTIGVSGLQAGESSNSSVTIGMQTFSISTTVHF